MRENEGEMGERTGDDEQVEQFVRPKDAGPKDGLLQDVKNGPDRIENPTQRHADQFPVGF